MNETEARVRCLELAAQLSRPNGVFTPEGVVEIATKLYAFTQTSTDDEQSPVIEDKPRRGRPPKV